jgi:tetratricopeptide (TPR) repeat protein
VRIRFTLMAMGLVISAGISSCAYYNTMYKAKSYYNKATPNSPYVLDKPDPVNVQYFNKSIDYSKKLLANYPKSKWVDDAYLLWAKALIGKEDPTETMTMLGQFPTLYPKSPLQGQALFYRGVAGRKSRQYSEALTALDGFMQKNPKSDLAPYAYLEQARVLTALNRNAEAAGAASGFLEHFPKHKRRDLAQLIRADALLAAGETEKARMDYRVLGMRAESDEDRFNYLLKEADCFEAGRSYDAEMTLLKTALAHESEPQLAPVSATPPQSLSNTPPGQPAPTRPIGPVYQPPTPSTQRWGKLMMRIGTVHLLAGRKDAALDAYRRIVPPFQQDPLGAEAQYRIGLTYETAADDFESARVEYGKVARAGATSPYALQAAQRLANLERLSQLRSGTGTDSLTKRAEAGFMEAELYLFQNNKAERSLQEYSKLASDYAGTPYAAKALNAQAWVLRHKLDRPKEADSLLWVVVRDYPRTEAQLSARDYLEAAGVTVPDSMIHPPEVAAPPDTGQALTPPPSTVDSLGVQRASHLDSLRTLFHGEPAAMPPPPPIIGPPAPMTGVHTPNVPVAPDTTGGIPAVSAPDTTRTRPR